MKKWLSFSISEQIPGVGAVKRKEPSFVERFWKRDDSYHTCISQESIISFQLNLKFIIIGPKK